MNEKNYFYTRRKLLKLACGTAASSLIFGCHSDTSSTLVANPDELTIFYGGTVLPVDSEFSEHQAMAVSGNRIIATGSNESILALGGKKAKAIDLRGRTVLPGFIEPHVHFALLAFTSSWHDIGPLKYPTSAEALAALKKISDEDHSHGWILARQFDPSLQAGPAMLTTRELDEISRTRPVFILNASGHIAYMNSVVLAGAGVNRESQNPPGAEYFRDETGAPNGAMTQKAYLPIILSNEEIKRSFSEGSIESGIKVGEEAASLGITTLCDMATGAATGYAEFETYQKMFDTGRMKSRVRAYLYSEAADALVKSGAKPGQGDENVRIAGWKIVSDGSNQGRTGRQRTPYFGSHDHGIYYVQPDELKAKVETRAAQGWPLAIHGNGDAAIDSILDAIEAAAESGIDIKSLRCRIEHASILHDEQIERMKNLGVSPSFLINHVYFWGQTMRDNVFGPDKVLLLDRCASVEKAGLRWTMHSDAPVSNMGTLHKIRVAVARDLWREPDSNLAPNERVSVEAAIRAVTINAAWQCHSDHELGSLEKGKLADFVILDSDPRKIEPTKISSINVSETWMNGKPVFMA